MTDGKALVKVDRQLEALHERLSDDKHLQLIRDSYFKGCDDLEFQFAIETCRHLGLDPIAKQIYFIKVWDGNLRRDVATPVVSIDGLRLGAERSGLYAGQTPPEWCGPDGVWRDVWLGNGPPAAARVGVYRKDFERPVYGIAKYSSFVRTTKAGKPMAWWGTAPEHMLAKCAEAQALRKCLPRELSAVGRVQDAELREPAQDTPSFRLKQETLPASSALDAAIDAIRDAPTVAELDDAAQGLKGMNLSEPDRARAVDAWKAAAERLGVAARDQARSEAEADAAGIHNYGPEPMAQDEVDQVEFGFNGDGGGGEQ